MTFRQAPRGLRVVDHDCRDPLDTKHDGINVKDRLIDVVVERNVVLRTDWGIEVASPGVYRGNLVIDTNREGFQVGDSFSPIRDMVFEDNAVIRPGHDGFHIATVQAEATGMEMSRNTVIEAGEAGLLVASEQGVILRVLDFVALGNAVGFDGWGSSDVDVQGCGQPQHEAALSASRFRRVARDGRTCEGA